MVIGGRDPDAMSAALIGGLSTCVLATTAIGFVGTSDSWDGSTDSTGARELYRELDHDARELLAAFAPYYAS